jgi:hypothetical protein
MGHVASAAPTGELLPSLNGGGNGQHDREVFPYGVGMDCHGTEQKISANFKRLESATMGPLFACLDLPK